MRFLDPVFDEVRLAFWHLRVRFLDPVLERVGDLPIFKRIREFLKRHHTALLNGFNLLMLIGQAAVFYFTRHASQAQRLRDWGLQQMRHPGVPAFIITIAVFTFGKMASLWKLHAQRSYGISEVVFGTLLCFNTVYIAPKLNLSRLVGLGGAMYVISRGFNNIADSQNKNLSRGSVPD